MRVSLKKVLAVMLILAASMAIARLLARRGTSRHELEEAVAKIEALGASASIQRHRSSLVLQVQVPSAGLVARLPSVGHIDTLIVGRSNRFDFRDLAEYARLRKLIAGPCHEVVGGEQTELRALAELTIDGEGLRSIEQLPLARNLHKLTLTHTSLSSVEGISRFTELRELDVQHLASLAEIASLEQLEVLGCTHCRGKSLPPPLVSRLVGLTMDYSELTDWTWLNQMSQLRSLSLVGVRFPSVVSLASLRSLEFLDVSHTRRIDLSSIGSLPSVRSIHAEGVLLPASVKDELRSRASSRSRPVLIWTDE